jgi:hypothetical protein
MDLLASLGRVCLGAGCALAADRSCWLGCCCRCALRVWLNQCGRYGIELPTAHPASCCCFDGSSCLLASLGRVCLGAGCALAADRTCWLGCCCRCALRVWLNQCGRFGIELPTAHPSSCWYCDGSVCIAWSCLSGSGLCSCGRSVLWRTGLAWPAGSAASDAPCGSG